MCHPGAPTFVLLLLESMYAYINHPVSVKLSFRVCVPVCDSSSSSRSSNGSTGGDGGGS